jgi:hypothetical protein
MIDWLHELPVVWIGVVAFAGMALITAAIYFAVMKLGQVIAQREIVASLERALDARRQRIIVSGSRINAVKWTGLLLLAVLTLLAIAFVHSGNRRTAAVAMGVYAAAVAVVLIMLASQDRPFTGQLGLDPDVLEEVSPRSL